MIKVPDSKELSDFDLKYYTIPVLEKYTDRRGYIYILFDDMFPEYIKVGRTGDLFKRLIGYNADKPYRTAKMLYVSELFVDAHEIERKILRYMYDNTASTTLSKEWFMIEHKQKLIDIIIKAESVSLHDLEP